MLEPLFTHPVSGTTWLIVVAKGATHFYYDKETGNSVWQLTETNIDDVASRVNFDELAVLFAKANGLRVGKIERDRKRKPRISEASDKRHKSGKYSEAVGKEVPARDVSDGEVSVKGDDNMKAILGQSAIEDKETVYRVEERQEQTSRASVQVNGQGINKDAEVKPAGLDLGYSSSEEDGDEDQSAQEDNALEDSNKSESDDDDDDDDGDDGVNSGLDLGFESEEEGTNQGVSNEARKEFQGLLDLYEKEISLYDPWFLVEEELLAKLSQNPAFYGIPDQTTRERIFDEWVLAKTKSESRVEKSHDKFPTPKVVFFRFLQEFKPEVRKLFYPEFYKKHSDKIDTFKAQMQGLNPESLYRELRVTLNDYAEMEKANKKRTPEGNMKVAHVEAFLRQKLAKFAGKRELPGESLQKEADSFDLWMELCNRLRLPEAVVSNANNFIVGDEKRLACYLRVLGPAS